MRERFALEAVARLRADEHLPRPVLDLCSDDDLVAITQSVVNVIDEIARARVRLPTDRLKEHQLFSLMREAHKREVTLSELADEIICHAVSDERAERFYRKNNPDGDWTALPWKDRESSYVLSFDAEEEEAELNRSWRRIAVPALQNAAERFQ